MGFLDDLKRQADAAKALQTTDLGMLQRNAALADMACKTAFNYLNVLSQQLNVLQPRAKTVYRLDNRHVFNDLLLCDFRADARRKALRGDDVFDHVVLHYQLKSGRALELVKNFLPDIEKLESRLRQGGAQVQSEAVRHPDSVKLLEMRYAFTADFRASVRLTPDHDTGRVHFQLMNLDGFETVTVEFPAFEIGSARMDELARWLVGEPHGFLRDGQQLRRVEA